MDHDLIGKTMVEHMYAMIESRLTGEPLPLDKAAAIKKGSILGIDEFGRDALLKLLPEAMFGVPFIAGSLNYLMNKDLGSQEKEHKKRMRYLREQMKGIVPENDEEEV